MSYGAAEKKKPELPVTLKPWPEKIICRSERLAFFLAIRDDGVSFVRSAKGGGRKIASVPVTFSKKTPTGLIKVVSDQQKKIYR